MTIEQLAELLNRQPGHVRRMLINRGYLRQNGNPTVSSTREGLIREDGFIYAQGRDLFIQELGIRENPTTIEEGIIEREEEIEEVIVEEQDFQMWMNDTRFDFRFCGDYYECLEPNLIKADKKYFTAELPSKEYWKQIQQELNVK